MADIVLKRNDTLPTRRITLTEGSPATPMDLTNATSAKLMMKAGAGPLITRAVSFVTPRTSGQVDVTFTGADTATSGDYLGEVEITSSGGIETVPNDSHITISIVDDLG